MTLIIMLLLTLYCLISNSPQEDEKHYAFLEMTKEQAIEVQEAAEKYFRLPINLEIKLNDTTSIEFVLIPPGEFIMGSKRPAEELAKLYGGKASDYDLEYPQHLVKISKPFYMSIYEITQLQWSALMGNNPSSIHNLNLPVGDVSWDNCKDFCEKLSEKIGEKIRLPTEAEWEFACRAGTTTEFYFGDQLKKEQANFNNDSAVIIGSYPSNCWGLFDMHGNMLEWVEDAYNFYTDNFQIDPLHTEHQFGRMYRGGFYSGELRTLRSARRVAHHKSMSYEFYGFRVVYQID